MVIIFIITVFCIISSSYFIIFFFGKKMMYYKQLSDKHLCIMDVFNNWLIMLENNIQIEKYFIDNGYKTIAIYGMGYLGERLLRELEETDIEVKFLIDKKKNYIHGEIPVYSINDNLEPVDVIVITPVYFFYTIRKELRAKTTCKLISIDEIFSTLL